MSSRFAVLCLLFLHYFICSVDGFQYILTTSGRDVTYELKTSVPINLYGEYHRSLFIHSSGYIALGESDVKRIDINRFQQNKLIVPFYNQIYLRKTVLIQKFVDTVQLNDFSRTVRTHFSDENMFQADEIISIKWSVYATFAKESMQTLTLLIGSNKDTSYVEIKYEHSKSKLYENFLYFVYGTPIAGFSAGDGVRYHQIYRKVVNELFTDVLSKRSNIALPGRWLFKLGSVGGSNSNFAIGLPDAKLEGGNIVDNDECVEGVSQCHEFATCSNRNLGYICQCNEGYFGNGKVCLPKGSRVFVFGSITGTMNGHAIPNSDNTILVQPTGAVAVTVIPLKEDLGHTFRLLPMIHGLVTWLFAKSDSSSNGKGFDIVGDRIIAKTLINFIGDPGELYITQKTMGFKNGGLALQTEISGATPHFGPIKSFDISSITEDFAESNVGTTSSMSHPTIRVNGKEYKAKVSRLVMYEPSLKKMSDLKHQLHINFDSATYSSYSTLSGLDMKFNGFIKNMKDDGTSSAKKTCKNNPCGTNSKCRDDNGGFTCDCVTGFEKRGSLCVDIDECATGRACSWIPNTKCENRDGSYQCVCNDGYQRSAQGCVAIGKREVGSDCRSNRCGPNSDCVEYNGVHSCQCKPGFEEQRSGCVDIDECRSDRSCSSIPNTRCINREGSYQCECVEGYRRTAAGCEAAEAAGKHTCRINCGANSKCVDRGNGFECVCDPGFEKTAAGCQDINECARGQACISVPNSKCENRIGAYTCVCKIGYKRTTDGCVDTRSAATCRDKPCRDNARCVDTAGGYECICEPGFKKEGSECVDIDECVIYGSRACGSAPNTNCENRPGTYRCVCKDGFKRSARGCEALTSCRDNPCGPNAYCLDENVGYTCKCNKGYKKHGSLCVDIDECATSGICERLMNSRCVNTEGSYECKCKPFYARNQYGCKADDSRRTCANVQCGKNSKCVDRVEGYTCICDIGFEKNGPNSHCEDINECETPGICQSEKNTKCENRVGKYECVCKDGFAKTPQGCKAEIHCKHQSCGDNAKCAKSGATYKCECDRGFEKKGLECVDTDECATGRACLTIPNTRCENRIGAYTCVCIPGFKRTAQGCEASESRSCRDNPCGANSRCIQEANTFKCECSNGFRKSESGCVDIDECETAGICRLEKNTDCRNKKGSYECVCKNGFSRTLQGCTATVSKSCRDNPCGANAKCVDETVGYRCECQFGFKRIGQECVDIDECDVYGSAACESAPNTKCENRPGTYRCVCKTGFQRTEQGCEVYNSCKDQPCGANSKCLDLRSGGFQCTCKVGFYEKDSSCIDINECKIQDICGRVHNTKCVNKEGSYECVCNDGFTKTVLGCEVAKGCKSNPCGPHATCNDEADGTHSCTCKRGFGKRGSICADLDECLTRNACDYVGNSRCVNLEGTYTCVCKTGYKRTGNGCEGSDDRSIDDCSTTSCGPNAKCLLSGGSYSCQCDNGYQKIGSSCFAVEDCSRRPCRDNSKCEYSDGTYSCKCDDGFQKIGSICVDVNECNQAINACILDKNLKCVNSIGSYTCVCKSGYKENEDGTCSELKCGCGKNEECAIVAGQPFCRCKPGYEVLGQDCVDKDECKSGDHNCPSNSICVNAIGRYICQCKSGYTKTGNMCVNFVRFTGMWVVVYKNGVKDMLNIKKDGKISVKSKARTTSELQPTDNEKAFPTKDGWFMAKDVTRPNTWDYIRLKPDGTLEIQHFCSDGCKKSYGPDAITQYCCPGIGKKPTRDIDECESGKHNCSKNHQCVNTIGSYRCDCKKGFEENGDICDDIDECVYNVCGRKAKCVNTAGSYLCQCNAGYKKIGSVCTDIDECEQEDTCGKHALCVNTDGGNICNCPINYVFAQNGKDCERACSRCLNGGKCIGTNQCQCPEGFSGDWCQYKTKDDFLLFAQSGSVKRLSVPYRSRHFGYLHTKYGNNIVGVDYDCKDNMIFYSDTSRGEIGTVTYTGLRDKVVIKGLLSPEGVTVDWLGRNVFWVDSRAKTVNVGSLDGKSKKNLFHKNVDKPRAITNNPLKGKLYWTDWYRQNPRIESSNMDGSDRKVVVNSTFVKTPNGLSINYIDNELCWTDAGIRQIACIDLGGSGNIRILVTKLLHPFSLTFHGEHLFWTDWKIDTIQRMNLNIMQRGKPLKTGISYDGQLYDIKSVQKCRRGCEESDYDYAGYDIKVVENVNSTAECNALCKETVGCKYFTYHTKDHQISLIRKTCALKSSNAGRVYQASGIISGSISCDIETTNKCSHNNGGCPHLCLMKGANERTCADPEELNLSVSNVAP